MSEEVWAPVPGWPDYDVSTGGRMRRATGGRGVRAGRILKPQRQPNGYLCVNLYRQGIPGRKTVHSVVTAAHIGPRPAGAEVNHLDGDKTNNRLGNLEYCNSNANKRHAAAHGLAAMGARNGAARLTDAQVLEIRELLTSGLSQRAVAARFGISQGYASQLQLRQRRRQPTTYPVAS